ncbi:MAG TPA: hypothetical protein VGN48_18045 [Pedococcus sp.]|nr:hypothetical protein [Pedococcus sp.]
MSVRRALGVLAILGVVVVGGYTEAVSRGAESAPSAAAAGATPTPDSRYAGLVDALHARGTGVWIESDFVKAYLAGPTRYHYVLNAALALARHPGVLGIKVADELGYHDGTTPAQAAAVLRKAVADIHTAMPATKVLIDVVVPELGCLSWTAHATSEMRVCGATARGITPGASIAAVDGYAASGVDVIDLSTGLHDNSWYAAQGSSRDDAMRQCWQEAVRRWGSRVTLQARKALAHAGRYTAGIAQAEADVHTYVDIPLAEGAKAADIWTWAQHYQGELVTITDPQARPNALTRALQERRARGARLWTHMTPSTLQVGLQYDVSAASQQFDVIFVAAGTG